MQKNRKLYLLLIFGIGLTSLIYEIYCTRIIFLFFIETNQAITISISAFLAGLAFSSLIFSRLAKNSQRYNILIIWCMQIAIAVYGFFVLRHYDFIPLMFDFLRNHLANQNIVDVTKIILMWIYLFIPAFFIGGSFPLVNGLYLESKEKGTHDTGLVYFWDTFGSILGAFLAGFFLLPYLGFRISATVVVLLNLMISLFIAPKKKLRLLSVVCILFVLLAGFSFQRPPDSNMAPVVNVPASISNSSPTTSATDLNQSDRQKLQTDTTKFKEFPKLEKQIFGDVLFQEMSAFGKITVGQNYIGDQNDKILFINYRDMCHSAEHDSESKIGQLAIANLPNDSRVLNIGLGCGFTASAIAGQKNVSHLDIAEINPVIAKGAESFFQDENQDVLNSPKSTLYIEDGAEFIRNTNKKYDAIVIDIEEVSIIYSSPLYTQEYFKIARNILKQNGVLALWAHRGGDDFEKIIYNTLQSVFPNVEIRLLDGFYTFYASTEPLNIDLPYPATISKVSKVFKNPLTEINTLDNRVLEKYFDIYSYFNLPKGYKEEFLK